MYKRAAKFSASSAKSERTRQVSQAMFRTLRFRTGQSCGVDTSPVILGIA